MQSYVISLKSADKRRAHIQQQFSHLGIQYNFFDALTPDLAVPFAQELGLEVDFQYITLGELACSMSHVSLWLKMINENIAHMAIFEDDIYLGENSDYFLTESKWIKPEWNIIKLEAFAKRSFFSLGYTMVANQRKIYQLRGQNYGTAGYILSLDGAKALFDGIRASINVPLDHYMFEKFVRNGSIPVYQMNPALCIQDMMLHHFKDQSKSSLPSMLIAERGNRMKKSKKVGWHKLILEISRLMNQFKLLFFSKRINFK